MMRFMEGAVTEKPRWERRVTDQIRLENWGTEASSQYGISTQAWGLVSGRATRQGVGVQAYRLRDGLRCGFQSLQIQYPDGSRATS